MKEIIRKIQTSKKFQEKLFPNTPISRKTVMENFGVKEEEVDFKKEAKEVEKRKSKL